MDRTQRIIVLLLVLAIVFSGISIIVSFTALNVDIPSRSSGRVIGESSGGVSLTIEKPPILEGEG
jgi:hypothetical protein